MQNIAAEMNCSETAFLSEAAEATYAIRYFTPETEVPLCGHATLSAAHILRELNRQADSMSVKFLAGDNTLTIFSNAQGKIQMDFPVDPFRDFDKAAMEEVTNCDVFYAGLSASGYHLAVLPAADLVYGFVPDFSRFAKQGVKELCITAREFTGSYDFVSRFFAPGVGIPEDPVTGTAHCILGPYWSEVLHKKTMIGRQVSRRNGVVEVEVLGNGRVRLGGKAKTVFEVIPSACLVDTIDET